MGTRCANLSARQQKLKKYAGLCPKCKKPLTIGVMNRVDELADRTEAEAKKFLVKNSISFRSLVPLPEIIADVLEIGVPSKAVTTVYNTLIKN